MAFFKFLFSVSRQELRRASFWPIRSLFTKLFSKCREAKKWLFLSLSCSSICGFCNKVFLACPEKLVRKPLPPSRYVQWKSLWVLLAPQMQEDLTRCTNERFLVKKLFKSFGHSLSQSILWEDMWSRLLNYAKARLRRSELLWNVSCCRVPQITSYFHPFGSVWPILAWADWLVCTSLSGLREERKKYSIGKVELKDSGIGTGLLVALRTPISEVFQIYCQVYNKSCLNKTENNFQSQKMRKYLIGFFSSVV